MNNKKHERYFRELKFYSNEDPHDSWCRLLIAICHTQLGNFSQAQNDYRQTLERGKFQKGPGYRYFVFTGEIEKLGEVFILANQPRSFRNTWKQETENYRLGPRSDALVAQYACALQCLVVYEDQCAEPHIHRLLQKPKVKDMFATGKIFEAIVSRDQLVFDSTLNELITVHHRMATYGSLRETPLGFLCLGAMALSKMALERGMVVNIESEYLSKEYLDYIAAISKT